MKASREHHAGALHCATLRPGVLHVIAPLALMVFLACSDEARPAPPDMAGAGGDEACRSDLPGDDACVSGVPSYSLEVAPIVDRRCAICHYSGNTQSSDVFAGYADLYSERQTVLTRIYTCAMPPEGAPSLTPEERQTVLTWFVCGAPDN